MDEDMDTRFEWLVSDVRELQSATSLHGGMLEGIMDRLEKLEEHLVGLDKCCAAQGTRALKMEDKVKRRFDIVREISIEDETAIERLDERIQDLENQVASGQRMAALEETILRLTRDIVALKTSKHEAD